MSIINHRLQFVEGPFNTIDGRLICVGHKKYGCVELCFAEQWNIPFGTIKLHSKDRAVDADAVFGDAKKLGDEIARRWNQANTTESEMEAAIKQAAADLAIHRNQPTNTDGWKSLCEIQHALETALLGKTTPSKSE